MYLLDTNVVSEIVRRAPHPDVMSKITALSGRLYASEMTRFELRVGALLKPDATAFWARIERKIVPLVRWLEVTKPIAERAGEMAAGLQRVGRQAKDPIDPLLAATAVVHGLILVTRNVSDFERISDVRIENWFATS